MKAIVTDYEFPDVENEKRVFEKAGIPLETLQSRNPDDLIKHCRDADALLVQWAPINREVLAALDHCKVIVRYGIGYDNVDIAAAERGIPVCNVPDYATGEVADHAMSLALALGRQLPFVDRRLRSGVWKIVPDRPMPSFRDMRFVTLGFGRIAREVLLRARPFGFEIAAHDPFVPDETLRQAGILPLTLDQAFATADILSLHLPVTQQTGHLINAESLKKMKKSAILINTSRGPLVDTRVLAETLRNGGLLAAGLDVFETEPLEKDHPILSCPNTLLTSHLAWHSASSISRLQTMTAEEAVRGLRGEPLRSQVNGKR